MVSLRDSNIYNIIIIIVIAAAAVLVVNVITIIILCIEEMKILFCKQMYRLLQTSHGNNN